MVNFTIQSMPTTPSTIPPRTSHAPKKNPNPNYCVLSLVAVVTFTITSCSYLTVGALLTFATVIGQHLTGKYVIPGYKLYMPFSGGAEFVLLQAQATFLSVMVSLIAICMYVSTYTPNTFFCIALACIQVASIWLALESVLCFDSCKTSVKVAEIRNIVGKWDTSHRWMPASFVLTSALFFSGSYVPGFFLSLVSALYSTCIPMAKSTSTRYWKLWRFLRPFSGGWEFMMLQAQGWFLCGMLGLSVLTIYMADMAAAPCIGWICSLLQCGSLCCLCTSVHYWNANIQHLSIRNLFYALGVILFFGAVPFLECWFFHRCAGRHFLILLLAAPLMHTSACLLVPKYKGLRLSGCFTSMLLQTNGRFCYIIAIVCSQMDPKFFAPILCPCSIMATICVCLSVLLHDCRQVPQASPGTPITIYFAFFALFVLTFVWLELSLQQLALVALVAHTLVLPLGIHMMWTYWWLISSILAVLVGNEFLLSVCAVSGLGISIPWYISALGNDEYFIGKRILWGMSQSLTDQYHRSLAPYFGNAQFRGVFYKDMSYARETAATICFWAIDLSVHLIPSILLLCYLKDVSLCSVVVSLAAAYGWRIIISCHHLSLDWDLLFKSARVRWVVLRSPPVRVCAGDVWTVNAIYGFVSIFYPDVPYKALARLGFLEMAVHVVMGLFVLIVEPSTVAFISKTVVELTSPLQMCSVMLATCGVVGYVFLIYHEFMDRYISAKNAREGKNVQNTE